MHAHSFFDSKNNIGNDRGSASLDLYEQYLTGKNGKRLGFCVPGFFRQNRKRGNTLPDLVTYDIRFSWNACRHSL